MDARVLTRELFLGDNANWKLLCSTRGSAVHARAKFHQSMSSVSTGLLAE
jgi:hypothetical protein